MARIWKKQSQPNRIKTKSNEWMVLVNWSSSSSSSTYLPVFVMIISVPNSWNFSHKSFVSRWHCIGFNSSQLHEPKSVGRVCCSCVCVCKSAWCWNPHRSIHLVWVCHIKSSSTYIVMQGVKKREKKKRKNNNKNPDSTNLIHYCEWVICFLFIVWVFLDLGFIFRFLWRACD